MAVAFGNFALDDLVAKAEDAGRLASLAIASGQRIAAFGGDYYRCWLGDAVVIVRTRTNYETNELELLGMDTHGASDCVWDCRIVENITPPYYDDMDKRLLVTGNGTSMAVVEVVNSDVLTSFEPGTPLRLNMVAFPRWIDYHTDEESYRAAQEKKGKGENSVLLPGGLFACGYAHCMDSEMALDNENLVLLRGVVKDMKVGQTAMGLEPMTTYIRTTVETKLGDIEICHTAEMVAEEQKELAKVGATVSALCVLSGDVAIGGLASGVFYSEKTDLELLKQFFEHGNAERLRSAFHGDCTYISERSEETVQGADSVTALFKDVEEAMSEKNPYYAYLAHITGVDQVEGRAMPVYGTGKPCLLLAQGEPDKYVALCFVETDSFGRIRTLRMSCDERYDFELD